MLEPISVAMPVSPPSASATASATANMIPASLHRHIVRCVTNAGRDLHHAMQLQLDAMEAKNAELERRNAILILECITAEDALAAFDGTVAVM